MFLENQAAKQVTREVSRIKRTTIRPAYSFERNLRGPKGQGVSLLVISLCLRGRTRKQTKTELIGRWKEGVRKKTKIATTTKKMKTPSSHLKSETSDLNTEKFPINFLKSCYSGGPNFIFCFKLRHDNHSHQK